MSPVRNASILVLLAGCMSYFAWFAWQGGYSEAPTEWGVSQGSWRAGARAAALVFASIACVLIVVAWFEAFGSSQTGNGRGERSPSQSRPGSVEVQIPIGEDMPLCRDALPRGVRNQFENVPVGCEYDGRILATVEVVCDDGRVLRTNDLRYAYEGGVFVFQRGNRELFEECLAE